MQRHPQMCHATFLLISLLAVVTFHLTGGQPISKEDRWSGVDESQTMTDGSDAEAVRGFVFSENDFKQPETEPPMNRVRRVPLSVLMKRALSLFTQWRPSGGGSGRIGEPGSDFVSAVPRDAAVPSRPRGQPLRWGK